MNRKLYGAGGLAIAAVLLVSLNVLADAGLRSVRLDLTEDHLYTLSDGSRKLLGELTEPITLRLYFSEKVAKDYPPLPAYAQRVEELLGEYASLSNGHIRLEVSDPEPFSETEDEAVRYGLQGVPLPGGGGSLYFGLAGTNSVGDTETIAFFQPDKETFLEYDLSRIVWRLAHPDRTVVGVLSSLPVEGQLDDPRMLGRQAPQPWIFMDQVRQLYETKSLQPNLTEVPSDVDVLMVIHPKALPDSALYAIDQYVLGGGRLLVFVDPFCEADTPPTDPSNPMAAMTAKRSSDLEPLFKAWGLELVKDQLAGDLDNALQVTYPGRTGQNESVSYVLWQSLQKDDFDSNEVITDGLSSVIVKSPGILQKLDGAATTFVPLMQTSTNCEEIPVSQVQFGPDPAGLLSTYFSPDRPKSDTRYTLAARIGGKVTTAYPGGKPAAPAADGQDPAPSADPAQRTESEGDINVVVVADCDLLVDGSWAQAMNFAGQRMISKRADNGDLVLNALDFLGGSTDLISLRGRGGTTRPFTVVAELQKQAEAAYRAEEQRLLDKQNQVEQELNKLLTQQQGNSELLITPEMQTQIEGLRKEQADTRSKLRAVRHDLNRDVEALGSRIRLINIAAIPLLVSLSAVALAFTRARRRRTA